MYNIGWLQRDSIINNYYPIIQNLITDLCFGLRLPEGCYEGRTLSKNDGATYICYKGYFRDCSEMVLRIDEERLRNEALLERNHIEIFLTFEHLPWIALPLPRTLEHATLLTSLISKYIRTFEKMPPLPVPVAVHEMHRPIRDLYQYEVTQSITPSAQINLANQIDKLCKEGLAGLCYISHHTGGRLAQLINRGHSFKRTKSMLLKDNLIMSPQGAAPGAIEALRMGFVEIISIGYVFASPNHTGHCLQLHNMTTCGSFLDTDSILPLNGISSTMRDRLIAYNVSELSQSLSLITEEHPSSEAFRLLSMLREEYSIRLTATAEKALFEKLSLPIYLCS